MEEITENHPNSEKGEERSGEHIPIITQRKEGRGEETGLTSSGAVLTAARRHKSTTTM